MKVFDGHTDIFTDVVDQFLAGNKKRLTDYHIHKLRKGGIVAGNFVLWDEPKYKNQRIERLKICMDVISQVLLEATDHFTIVKSAKDFKKAEEEKLIAVIIGMEGMAPIETDFNWIEKLYDFGVRVASFTWNEENMLATGIEGDANRGLTKDGITALRLLEEMNIIVDVSHLNERSFWDVVKHAKRPIIASHSNAYTLCNHMRNLKDAQIDAIQSTNGIMCVNACADFIDSKQPSVEKVVDHIDHIVDRIGINHIALGFDFCDFLSIAPSESEEIERVSTLGLSNASQTQNIIHSLIKRGYTLEDVSAIAYKNLENFYAVHIGKISG